jgi:hypothetical protein
MSKWRERYKVHPAADVFPMMSDEELAALGGDILLNGGDLHDPITFVDGNPPDEILDGRNRLEAMERVGLLHDGEVRWQCKVHYGDPFAYVASKNLHRRHMLKSERADAIVALAKLSAKKPDQDDPVSKGGRGKKNAVRRRLLRSMRRCPRSSRSASLPSSGPWRRPRARSRSRRRSRGRRRGRGQQRRRSLSSTPSAASTRLAGIILSNVPTPMSTSMRR